MRNRSRFFTFIEKKRLLIIFLSIVLSVASILYTRHSMTFLTGRDDLMPRNTSFNADYRAYRAEFGDQEEIAVVVESSDPSLAMKFGDRLAAALKRDRNVREVFFPGGLEFFRKNGLLFMPLDELKTLRTNLGFALPVLSQLAKSPSVQTLFTSFTDDINGYLQSPDPQRLARLTFLLERMDKGFERFGGGATAFSLDEFFLDTESTLAKAGRMQILTVLPVKAEGSFVPAEAAIQSVRREIGKLRQLPEFKGVTVGITGTPVLEYEEMKTSEKDMSVATILSLALTVVLLLVAFRGIVNALAALFSMAVALCLSFGFATLAVGHLNILSMVFAVMLIGIGIEYGIQVVLRYQEELGHGIPRLDALDIGVRRNIVPIIMAAATVAAAFGTFIFTDFKGIAELGVIAAGGVVICVLVTFTVLPAVLAVIARRDRDESGNRFRKPAPPKMEGRLSRLLFGQPKTVLILSLLVSAVACYPALRVRFDYNLMNLQAKGLESVEYAYRLMKNRENSGYFAVVVANSAADAVEKTKRLEAMPTVDHVVSMNTFVPDRQDEKLAILADLRGELADIKPEPYQEDLQVMELPAVFEGFRNAVEALKNRLEGERNPDAPKIAHFLATLDSFFKSLEKEKDRNALGMLRDFQGNLFASLPEKIGELKGSLPARPVTAADVPAELRSRFVGRSGKLLLQVAPKEQIFERDPLKRFLDDVRKVDPHATGEPVMVYESMTIMKESYRNAFLYAFAAIVVILFLTFRSIRYTIIGLVPLLAGLLFMVAGMGLTGINFNSANIIVLPLLLGIAVDSAIYIVNRYRRENETPGEVITSSTGIGVICNTLTIMVSFGALMVARHQGVYSIGTVMSLGMLACQVAFILILPAVLSVAGRRKGRD